MNLPFPYKDVANAKRCLDKALENAPNNLMLIHTIDTFYERYEKDIAEAMKYYERASELGVFGAHMDLLRLRYSKRKTDYNPIPDLELALEKYHDKFPYHYEVLMQMGSFYFFIKNDIENAFKCWEKVIDQDPDAEKLKMHKCMFLRMLKPVNVYEILCGEARLALQSNAVRAQEEESLYEKIIMKCTKCHPACGTASPLPHREMVLAEVHEAESQRFRPRVRGRGRGRCGKREVENGRGHNVDADEEQSLDNGEGRQRYSSMERERGGGYRGRDHGRGNRGGQQGRGNRSSGRGYDYYSRHSSTDRYHKDNSRDREYSGVRNYTNDLQRCSRESSAERYHNHHINERQRFSESQGDDQIYECSRKDFNADSYYRHHSSEGQGFSLSRDNRTTGAGYCSGRNVRDSSVDNSNRYHNTERQGFSRNSFNRTICSSTDSGVESYQMHRSSERLGLARTSGSNCNGECCRSNSSRNSYYNRRDQSQRDYQTNNTGPYCVRDSSCERYEKDKGPDRQNHSRRQEYSRDSSVESSSRSGPGNRRRDSSIDSVGGRRNSLRGRNYGRRPGHIGRYRGSSSYNRDVESRWYADRRE